MRPDNQHRSGSLETDPSLDTDDRIAHVHITADTVSGPDLLDLLDSGDLILEHLTIHGMNLTVLELDAQLLAAGLLHLFQISALGQSLRGIKNLATADRGSPKTYVIGIFQLREIGLETVLLQVVDLKITAQGHIAGQRDNLHVRSQYQERQWKPIRTYQDILFDFYEGIARITINRPRYRNAFTPLTAQEISNALLVCRETPEIRVVVLTGAGDKAFCSGGDMHVKGRGGYVGGDGVPRLNILDVQKQIRSLPKPVIAMVNGYAIGGGHVLHVVCDLSIASENAIFGQTGPRVGSFDAGFGSSYLARIVGQKKAREIWFLCRQYSAQEALDMGLVNKVVPADRLEDEVVEWAKTMMQHSPLALRMIKAGLNAELDGQAGIQELAGDATMLYYMTDEAQEGGKAFLEKRKPEWDKFPFLP